MSNHVPPAASEIAALKSAFKGRPLLFVEIPTLLAYSLRDEPHRLERFTHTWDHHDTPRTKLPTLAILEIAPNPLVADPGKTATQPGLFLARVERSGKVASFQVRLKFTGAFPLAYSSLEDLMAAVMKSPVGSEMGVGLRAMGNFSSLKLVQNELIDFLWEEHRARFAQLARPLPGALAISEAQRQQEDAVKLAKLFFGLRSSAGAEDIHVQEINAIGCDAAMIPGFELIAPSLRGAFKFRNDREELTIYNAHNGPIEELLGVDLVYVNETQGSIVMVQYKVLESEPHRTRGATDWTFRPDPQFHDEVRRMRLPDLTRKPDDYRLHPDPFFFKFVRRKQLATPDDTSLILSLNHVEHLLASDEHRGPRGGVRFSYDALRGQYLRASDFVGLVRSGYIGTHRIDSDWLKILLKEISAGKRGLVLGWQRPAK